MKKKNVSLIFITFIIILAVIASATYSYFVVNMFNISNVVNINTNVINSKSVFISYSNDTIDLNVTLANMIVPSMNATASDTGDLIVKFSSPIEGQEMECTYNIAFVWDSTDQYTTTSGLLTAAYPYELSIAATVSSAGDSFSEYDYTSKKLVERDLTTLAWTGTAGTVGRKANVITGAKIYSNTVAGTTATWSFTMKFYTVPYDQNAISGKSLLAHLTTTDIEC